MDDYDRSLASNRNDTTDDFKDVYFGSQVFGQKLFEFYTITKM